MSPLGLEELNIMCPQYNTKERRLRRLSQVMRSKTMNTLSITQTPCPDTNKAHD